MRTANNHPYWENQPLRLNEDQKQDLYSVVEDFCSFFHLQDMREILWDWLVAALSCDHSNYSTGLTRSNLIFVYENLELLMEAIYEINKRRNKKRKRQERKSMNSAQKNNDQ